MSVSKRRWNSMDHLDETNFRKLLTEQNSIHRDRFQVTNLTTLKNLSESSPSISVKEEEEEENKIVDLVIKEAPIDSTSEDSECPSPPTIPPTKSVSRQRKFIRHFQIDDNVLDYYSCALAIDILLQGFIYITHNYFAFYSNVFGRVTKVLIPVCTIEKITKNNFLIFPNAIHVHTNTEKHVFGSLLSRDTAYALMHRVWTLSKLKSTTKQSPRPHPQERSPRNREHEPIIQESHNESSSDSASGPEPVTRIPSQMINAEGVGSNSPPESPMSDDQLHPLKSPTTTGNGAKVRGVMIQKKTSTMTDKIVILICFLSIIILTLSAVHLYQRIDLMVQENNVLTRDNKIQDAENEQLFTFQKLLHGNSAKDFVQRVDNNIERIRKVSESLEACYIGHNANDN